MTGERLAELMRDDGLKAALAKHARRHSQNVETQEEYLQDAWLRIANEPGGRAIEYYCNEGGKAIHAAWRRERRRRVDKKHSENVHGIGVRMPKTAIPLGRGRWLDTKPERLDPWYYDGEWEDLGVDKSHYVSKRFYKILIEN